MMPTASKSYNRFGLFLTLPDEIAYVADLQTIDSIVPVMVASLKQSHFQGLDLFIGAKDFLRVFTDAANHVPRHRRNK